MQYMLLAVNISSQGNDAVSPFSFIVWKVLRTYLHCNSNIDSGYHHSSHWESQGICLIGVLRHFLWAKNQMQQRVSNVPFGSQCPLDIIPPSGWSPSVICHILQLLTTRDFRPNVKRELCAICLHNQVVYILISCPPQKSPFCLLTPSWNQFKISLDAFSSAASGMYLIIFIVCGMISPQGRTALSLCT